ncbi:MAG: hypothetical protein ACLFTK_02170 [Anaerolineales bacterium]
MSDTQNKPQTNHDEFSENGHRSPEANADIENVDVWSHNTDTTGAFLLFVLGVILFFALLRAQARNRHLNDELAQLRAAHGQD